ncbi:MAG TPA: hypothetical protein VGB22_02300 [candidate division Zixibacteria bacterium]|jgi:hypothetical protein
MKAIIRFSNAILCSLGILLIAYGCPSSPDGNGNGIADYELWVVLEKNLDANSDNLSVEFRHDGDPVSGGSVSVAGDPIITFDNNGNAQKSYSLGQWTTGAWIHIIARDSTGAAVYRDSIVIPSEFLVNVFPEDQPWRPGQTLPRIEWGTSIMATNYAISVRARTAGNAPRGFAEYYQSAQALSQTFQQSVFSDIFDNVIPDMYDIHVVASSPNFIEPSTAHAYRTPDFDDIPQPIDDDDVTGAIAALCVAERVTVSVETLQ